MKTLKYRYVPLLVAACFGVAGAAPTLPQVVAGQATFNQQGNVFSITNTPGTIINWQGFSVNQGEVTRFIQQSADSAVLNRVLGQDPTRILGALQSNGKVFLINPNGILFGRDSRVDVNALVASTLNMADADFLAGKKNFSAGAVAGSVRNEGTITTPSGGQVFLIAPNVENTGIVTSPKGEVVLAAGHSVQLVDSANPDLHVVVAAPDDKSINLGQLIAQGGKIGIYGALVHQRGLVSANSALLGENGKIVLKASRATLLEQGSVTTATATGAGKGGTIHLLGEQVGLDGNAAVDASGAAGGGTVLAGGDYQGRNALLPNAQQTWLGKDASIRADALGSGDGGKVVLWSDGATRAAGSISARAGAAGGNGGLVETSGHKLDVSGIAVDTGAARGKRGTWLLDPDNVEVVANPGSAAPGNSEILAATLNSANSNVVLQAINDLTVRAAIDTAYDISATAGHDMTVEAMIRSGAGNIDFRAGNSFNLRNSGSLKSGEYIDLQANSMALNGTIGGAGGQQPIVTFTTRDPSRPISIVSLSPDNTNGLWLEAAALTNRVNAFEINIGNAAHNAPIRVDGALSLSANLVFETANEIAIAAPINLASAQGGHFIARLHDGSEGGISIGGAGSVTAAASVLLEGDRLSIGGAIAAPGVSLMPNNAATTIRVGGTGNGGGLWLGQTALGNISAGELNIGGLAGHAAPIEVSGALDLRSAGPAKLTLDAGAAGLTIDATATVRMGNRDINLRSSGAMSIAGEIASDAGKINLASQGSMNIGGKLGTASGTINATADDGMTVAGRVVTDGGNIALTAARNGKFTSNEGALIRSERGEVTVVAGTAQIFANTVQASSPDKLHLPGAGGGTTPAPPALEACLAARSAPGCADVLNAATLACIADGSPAHCAAVLPKVEECKANSSALGCDAVLARDALLQCIADPKGASCGAVLPRYEVCEKTPATLGCVPVVAQHNAVAACIADPKATGCASVLPALQVCRNDASVFGCAPVLGRAEFDLCLATPTGPGCSAVLPQLPVCKATPSTEGCAQVLQVTFNSCLSRPNDASCTGILPTLSQCVVNKSMSGCDAVLPTLAQCIGSPSLQGCEVRLPALAQCAVAPNLSGCEAVLPSPTFCSTHPADPSCQPLNPGNGSQSRGTGVSEAVKATVNLINSGSPASSGTGGGAGDNSRGPSKPSDKQSGPAPTENSGAKNEKPVKKMYCN